MTERLRAGWRMMAGKSITLKALRASADAQVSPRLGVRIVAVFVLLQLLLLAVLLLLHPSAAGAAPVKGDVVVSTASGYARLVFTLSQEIDTDIRVANGVLTVAFKQVVDIPVDRVPFLAAGYIAAARRDPEGTTIRFALNRRLILNSMAAGEKLFIDLLPADWTGLPPGLPQEVLQELANRAREAEKNVRQQLMAAQQRTLPPVRVRVSAQPTFTRYAFPLSELVTVSTLRAYDRTTLIFEPPLSFDLSDAQTALPPMVAAIESQSGTENIALHFKLIGNVDVRTFREDGSYIIDFQPIASGSQPAVEKKKPSKLLQTGASLLQAPEKQASDTIPQAVPGKAAESAAPLAGATSPSEGPTTVLDRASLGETSGLCAAHSFAEPADEPTSRFDENKSIRVLPDTVFVDVRHQREAVVLTFPFTSPTPGAMFRRANTIWLVFDSQAPIDICKIFAQPIADMRSVTVTRSRDRQVIQFKLDRPKLTSIATEGTAWTVVVGDVMLEPTQPLNVLRVVQPSGRASVIIPFERPQQLHQLSDAEVGDTLFVVTALGPVRGFLKPQGFVEFNTLVSTHGVVIHPRADDVIAEVNSDQIVVTRPGGLVLSNASARGAMPGQIRSAGESARAVSGLFVLDPQTWGFDREANFHDRQTQLVAGAAAADEAQRAPARLNLARFYLARDLFTEAKGVLDVTALEDGATVDGSAQVLRAITNVMLGRGAEAVRDLAHATVLNRSDISLWRALALAQQGKWSEAREGFRSLDTATATLPIELQRYAFHEAMRAAVEARDFGAAQSLLVEFDTLGTAREREADLTVLKGRVMEGLGRLAEALTFYRGATESNDRAAAARARLREIALRQSIGEINREDAITSLEALTMAWRGDETEAEALRLLGRLYAEDGRYRESFQVMRTALTVFPTSEMTRRIQDEATLAFESLFLGGKDEAMPPIDAVSLFYDFRDLTPVGRRGDEMIRKLADRLVSVDLLDQAAELLQHQVDNRLHGAARAQVAVRLAAIYLIARKPDRSIQVLRSSRSGDLPNELRNQRLMIEARAQSEVGRSELALEAITNLQGREVERLRADILWKARRWRDAGEQIEKFYGDRWREFTPLVELERADILRAAVAYALADDKIGLDRFRTKYAPKMAEGADRRAFEVVTMPTNTSTHEFAEVAKMVGTADTLESFLRDIRAKFPEPPRSSVAPSAQPAVSTVPQPGAAVPAGRAG